MKYRKKPVVIEARRFDPRFDYNAACAVVRWCGGEAVDEGIEIVTLEGSMIASPGDWVIRGVKGEFYPVKDEIFRETYEAVEEEAE